MEHKGTVDLEDDLGLLSRLAPSPHSETVAHEFQELSLHPNQYLPPLKERKNGKYATWLMPSLRDFFWDQSKLPFGFIPIYKISS